MVTQRNGKRLACVFLVLGSGARAGLGLKALATSAFGLEEPRERKTLGLTTIRSMLSLNIPTPSVMQDVSE